MSRNRSDLYSGTPIPKAIEALPIFDLFRNFKRNVQAPGFALPDGRWQATAFHRRHAQKMSRRRRKF